jgi:hypothetical protein
VVPLEKSAGVLREKDRLRQLDRQIAGELARERAVGGVVGLQSF